MTDVVANFYLILGLKLSVKIREILLTITKNIKFMQIYFTEDGIRRVKARLMYLRNNKIKEVARNIREALNFGSINENAAYEDAKEKEAFLHLEMRDLENKIRLARVVKKSKNENKVQIGSRILVLDSKSKKEFHIVEPDSVDSFKNKISYRSPLGKALLGLNVGDIAKFSAGEGEQNFRVIAIS